MKKCELCKSPARLFCQSDQASLCWECDSKVHGANFLVARHLRTLLCRACQSPTPWSASGPRLNSTGSVCSRCVGEEEKLGGRRDEIGGGRGGGGRDEIVLEDELSLDGDDQYEDGEDDEDEDEVEVSDEDDQDDDDEEDDDDNQVVPWSSPCSSPLPPPPATSSSSSGGGGYSPIRRWDAIGTEPPSVSFSLKRARRTPSDLSFHDDHQEW